MDPKKRLEQVKARLKELATKSTSADLTDDENSEFDNLYEEAVQLKETVAKAAKNDVRLGKIASLGSSEQGDDDGDDDDHAKSLGEHFVKQAGKRLVAIKGVSGASAAATEWSPSIKANTDTQMVGSGNVYVPYLTEFDRTIVQEPRPQLLLPDLLSSGTISGNTVQYLIEMGFEGAYGMVAEGGAKPQLHVADPDFRSDSLKKIAGFLKFTDEMIEDLPFIVTEINNRGLYELAVAVEDQLLNGDGTGQNVLGILNRSGVQTEAAASDADEPDAIFRAIQKVSTASGLNADAIVINNLDYQDLRLRKDGNGQYFGGGFFQGQYGNSGVLETPPLWGLRTIVTPRITQGTVLVGAFRQAATFYTKGGIRVESTNSHATDFTSNLVTTRIERRIALAVRRPNAFVDVTLFAGA